MSDIPLPLGGSEFDAVIIGAGPAGASAAILLAQHGWRIALVEKQNFPRRKVCGECIAASNLPLLDALGVGDRIARLAGPPLIEVALMRGRSSLRAPLPAYAHARHQWGIALGREYLDTILRDRALQWGVTVLQPWMVKSVQGGPGDFSCTLSQPNSSRTASLHAPVVIAAHGSWEIAPTPDFERPAPKASDLFAFKATYRNARLEAGLLPVLSFDGGYGGMVLGDHGLVTIACCIRRDTLQRCRADADGSKAALAVSAYLRAQCAGVDAAIANAQEEGAWLSVGPIRPGIRIGASGDGIFRIGNAAGEAHPIIGEGMSMAMQSAWLLSGKLALHRRDMRDAPSQARLLEDYTSAWRKRFSGRIRLAALFAHVAMRKSLSGAAVAILRTAPEMLTYGARLAGKVRCAVDPHRTTEVLPIINKQHA